MKRRVLTVAGSAALMAAVACGEALLHTNPYDPLTPVAMTIQGPDSMFNSFEFASFQVTTLPAMPDTAITYLPFGLYDAGAGTFESRGPPLWPQIFAASVTAAIGKIDTIGSAAAIGGAPIVQIYRHTVTKTVILTQRLVRIALRCPDAHACDTLAVGGTWSVWVDGTDGLGHQIVALVSSAVNPSTGPPIATFVVRDTTIARATPVGIRVANVTALRSGATWIVATRADSTWHTLSDSVQVVVR